MRALRGDLFIGCEEVVDVIVWFSCRFIGDFFGNFKVDFRG